MRSYSVQDVTRVLRLSRGTIRGMVNAGFVTPCRGNRRELLFSFRDMIVMRTARALIDARIPRRRIRHSLEDLRGKLPENLPLSGLSICAVGDRVVVRDGQRRWQADSGQYLLGLDVTQRDGILTMIERPPGADLARSADDWFHEALELEQTTAPDAVAAYRRATDTDPTHLAAWTNWGRLLHETGLIDDADRVYRRAIEQCGHDPLLMFNHGVLLEDLGQNESALQAYHLALEQDPDLADCHYNLARLYQVMSRPQHAIRHYGRYRRLVAHTHN
jgi:predicted Zn-dependent protease